MLVHVGERTAQEVRPGVIGEGVGRHAALREAQAWLARRQYGRDGGARFRLGARQRLLQRGDEVALARLGVDIALDRELGVGVLHANQADAEIFGEHALGGQLFLGRESALADVLLDTFIEMHIDAFALQIVEAICEHGDYLRLACYFLRKMSI